ncbi:MAG: hypothetical protein LBR97_06925 [Dysgonamonadaceae bacterium]|jgi:hypothetical protein|nr:hypothetical protein [Dysgonamonadaceae bacterium]
MGGIIMNNTATIINDGMNYLVEKLGIIETEIFISQIIREPFDYTKWQREHYANLSVSELNKKAVEYTKNKLMRKQD